jgi:hypothetical protein
MSPIRANALADAMMIRALLDGPCTISDLSEASGLVRRTVQERVKALRKVKAVYIAHWEQDAIGRYNIHAWQMGDERDAPKPKPQRLRLRREKAQRAAQLAMIRMTAGVAA